MRKKSVTLILLAAGNSLRFGTDKLRYPIEGEPMLSRCIRFYSEEGIGDFIGKKILVTQPSQDRFIREAEAYGYEIALNANPELGISESIRIGMKKAGDLDTEGFLFSVADQPYLSEKTVHRILQRFAADPSRIVIPSAAGKNGNPVVFPRVFFEELCSLQGDSGGKQIIKRHPQSAVTVEAAEQDLRDIDTEPEVKK